MSDLPPCRPEIYEAPAIAIIDTGEVGGAALFEAWLKDFAAATGTATDWHYIGGRAVVRTLNDPWEVQHALREAWADDRPVDPDGEPMSILRWVEVTG